MASFSELIHSELAAAPPPATGNNGGIVKKCSRWGGRAKVSRDGQETPISTDVESTSEASLDEMSSSSASASQAEVPPPPLAPDGPSRMRLPRSNRPSFILQHYHATGCAGGAFSWRGAMMDPEKNLFMCTQPREYRETNCEHIRISKEDKRRGGGPRVGPFQEDIPGDGWEALPKYDYTTQNRSSGFNERMHVEWECHADNILGNGGELPTTSVVAKAGFRSCAPCCRDMLALARPTGKAFIMVDLAEDDSRGTFHFVTGGDYLPVPKEACNAEQVKKLKKIVSQAQDDYYSSSDELHDAVLQSGAPVDETAQAMYMGDVALLPPGCGEHLRGSALLEVLHAEHFARLTAEYGASIIRDENRPYEQHDAVRRCRARARQMLIAAWRPHLNDVKVDLDAYASAAVAPLLPDDPGSYMKLKRSSTVPRNSGPASATSSRKPEPRWGAVGARKPEPPRLTAEKLHAIDEDQEAAAGPSQVPGPLGIQYPKKDNKSDAGSVAGSTAAASTAMLDDGSSTVLDDAESLSDWEDPDSEDSK